MRFLLVSASPSPVVVPMVIVPGLEVGTSGLHPGSGSIYASLLAVFYTMSLFDFGSYSFKKKS